MNLFAKMLFAGALAVFLCGCATPIVMTTTSREAKGMPGLPGYRPKLFEKFGRIFTPSDMSDSTAFVNEACVPAGTSEDRTKTLLAHDAFVLALGGSGGSGSGSTLPGAAGGPSLSGGSGGLSVSLQLAEGADPKKTFPVTNCSLKVIAAAVHLCAYRTLNKNALDKVENYGIGQVLAVAGTAATIAALSHASGSDTAWITGGAAVATTLLTANKNSIPGATALPISSIVNAGLSYVVLDDPEKSTDPDTTYGNLFNVAISQCPMFAS